MRQILFLFLLFPLSLLGQPLITRFEQSGGKQSPTYPEIISWWKKMDAASPYVTMKEMGQTDAGFPLHLVLVSWSKDFDIPTIKKKNKTIILVNNGIHPGEPDGIDASMLLVKELVNPQHHLPDNVVLAIIPVYNIGGALNRSPFYRVDQDGPEEFGFRGNAQNLDLNRDFIKCDSKNALSFSEIFHFLDPDIFIDNHVSNGADYQHVMTLLTTQHNKLGGSMGTYLEKIFEPAIYTTMKNMGWDLIPYVNHFGGPPANGWNQFWDSPRYSSGYTTLFNCFGFVPETHMLKPYPQRVAVTRDLMKSFIGYAEKNGTEIRRLRAAAKKEQAVAETFPIAWKRDTTQKRDFNFKGYAAGKKPSGISGLPHLYYDRSQPFEKTMTLYTGFRDTLSVRKPAAYIIPQGWWKVIDRLKANHVVMRRFQKDTAVEVEVYTIEKYQSGQRPFEGHHLNTNVQVKSSKKKMSFRKGDYFIPMNQSANRFLVQVLEPHAEDSYFAWNFFDPILGQKEGFSDYAFEETALEYLSKNPALKKQLDERKAKDSVFAQSAGAQLNFIYQNSPWMEPAFMQYPVYRLVK